MAWHETYQERVLGPDFDFAGKYLFHHFIDAMTAHLTAVARLAHVQSAEDQAAIGELRQALIALHDERVPERSPDVPDLYFALQRKLEARVGGSVAFVRVGLSRNDLDMVVYKMRGREILLETSRKLLRVRAALLALAAEHVDTVLIAQTHHQPGQPSTVAHYLSAVCDALQRDSQRLEQAYTRHNLSPLGAAALAGSSHPLDRNLTAALLGFDGPVANTYDAVAAADWQFDLVSASQSIALNAGRLICDLINWSTAGWYRLGDGLVQGSSIMPQKRNPVALEHARTRFSRALGTAGMVVYSAHNIPFADLNDFGPDVQGALQAQHLQLSGGLELLEACVTEGAFERDKLAAAAAAGNTTATELADHLARDNGVPFTRAHAIAAALVKRMDSEGRDFTAATPQDVMAAGGPELTQAALREALDPAVFVAARRGIGMPAPEVMAERVRIQRRSLAEDEAWLAGRVSALADARALLRG
ncbi:MAG: hypothetical protein KF813_11190 [Trueperaceae bacterium]|nr:hypothetical protein [Trueperaceae bacterium]